MIQIFDTRTSSILLVVVGSIFISQLSLQKRKIFTYPSAHTGQNHVPLEVSQSLDLIKLQP
jgi:hypothetical protein